MATCTNTTLTKLIVITSLSTSVVSLPYDNLENLIPEKRANYKKDMSQTTDWREKAFNINSGYTLQDEDEKKMQAIIDFSKDIIDNSKDIDTEYVDIVNENFWELI
jgi:hypothetical protein